VCHIIVCRAVLYAELYYGCPGKENTPEGGVYFVLHVFVLYFVLYLYFWRRPPVTVAAAASAMMAPRVLAVHLALGYAQCLTLSSIM
jgi:hypothetical protein